MVVRYVAYTWQGDKIEGVLDVDREEEARAMLQRDDLIPYELVRIRPIPSFSSLASILGGAGRLRRGDRQRQCSSRAPELFWGADLVEDTVLIDRLTEVTSRTLDTFNESSPEGPLPDDTPVYICGSPISRQPILHDDTRGLAITQQICHNLRMPKGEFDLPMDGGSEFPFNDLVVNAGLALRGV